MACVRMMYEDVLCGRCLVYTILFLFLELMGMRARRIRENDSVNLHPTSIGLPRRLRYPTDNVTIGRIVSTRLRPQHLCDTHT